MFLESTPLRECALPSTPPHLSPSKTNFNSDGLERLTLQNKPMTACFLSPGQLTCWSLEPGAPKCEPLDPCQVRTKRSLWRPEAPRSCPGSLETGTWCQSYRCRRRRDLEEKTHVCFRAFFILRHFAGLRHEVRWGKRHPPVSGRNLMSRHCQEFALTQLLPAEEHSTAPVLTSSNIPAAGVEPRQSRFSISASTTCLLFRAVYLSVLCRKKKNTRSFSQPKPDKNIH